MLSYKFVFLRRLLLAAALVSFAAMNTKPALADRLEDIKSSGVVTIAVANEPPWMTLEADGSAGGLGPEIDRAIFSALGFKVTVKGALMEYGAMIPAVQAGRVDLASSGALYIRPERCKSVSFSDPITCENEGFVIGKDLEDKVQGYKDVVAQKLKIGVCGGCSEHKLAVEAGISDDNIVIWPDGISGMKMLLDGRIDVFAHDYVAAADLQRKVGDKAKTVAIVVKDAPVACGGAAFAKSETALRDAYNEGLKKIIESGKYMEILRKYDLEYIAQGRDTVTTSQLCGE